MIRNILGKFYAHPSRIWEELCSQEMDVHVCMYVRTDTGKDRSRRWHQYTPPLAAYKNPLDRFKKKNFK